MIPFTKPLTFFISAILFYSSGLGAEIEESEIPKAYPSEHGLDERKILELVEWVKSNRRIPIFSILISRNGQLLLELYTSGIKRDDSHYLMSVTKSILSTIIGISIDKGIIASEHIPLNELIPNNLLRNEKKKEKFKEINLKDVMGMKALDVSNPPRDMSPSSIATQKRFLNAKNRFEFVLDSPVQKGDYKRLKYNDQTPMLASGILSYLSGQSAFDFARTHLFDPLGFKNYEWMHQDSTGINMGGYGLRLRPIDMQKIGILYLNNGIWNNKQIISKEWVDKTKHPYVGYEQSKPIYGYFWWKDNFGSNLYFQVASGWKGQRIAFNYDKNIVITMTACIEKSDENKIFQEIMKRFIIPAIDPKIKSTHYQDYDYLISKCNNGRYQLRNTTESRMIPSKNNKEKHIVFQDRSHNR